MKYIKIYKIDIYLFIVFIINLYSKHFYYSDILKQILKK